MRTVKSSMAGFVVTVTALFTVLASATPAQAGTMEPRIGRARDARAWAVVALLASLLVTFTGQAAQAEPPRPAPAQSAPAEPGPGAAVPPAERDRLLGQGWRSSPDLAWTTSGDATGFHVLVAPERDGYQWRTVATLSEPGFETDRWVGNACLAGSGRRALVVYAPRQFTNREMLFQRGAFAAVVDLTTGATTKLGLQVSLAYHNPGCGAGEQGVVNQSGGAELGKTRLHVVDLASGQVLRRVELPGQVTSAVLVGDKIVAAYRDGLTEITAQGATRLLASTHGPASYVRADAAGGVAFLEVHGERISVVKHYAAGTVRELARGPKSQVGLAAGMGGRIFLTGEPGSVAHLPATVTRLDAPASAAISTHGGLAVTYDQRRPAVRPDLPEPVVLQAVATGTGERVEFAVHNGPAAVGDPSPAMTGQAGTLAGSSTDPVEGERTCAIARNDPRIQVMQPHWKQVEWAANLAVKHTLLPQRPANWNQSGLPAWRPQDLVQPLTLRGGGRVPAQIMLGILAQESNLWQASNHALEGVTGNPLIGDYYGRRSSPDGWGVRWDKADCGYGVAQITDRMRVGQQDPIVQKAITVDYATNIAMGVRILEEKWNILYDHVRVHNADPAKIENWFAAVWAYNSGINPQASTGNTSGCTPSPSCTDSRGNWGLGWTNNPMNPDYPADRAPFLQETQEDARNPQRWPYPEKVLGWAAYPIVKYDFRKPDSFYAGYNQAWWTSLLGRELSTPPRGTFCDPRNHCDPADAQPCQELDFHCWWSFPTGWKGDCNSQCGNENMRFPDDYPEPRFATSAGDEPVAKMPQAHYPANCDPFASNRAGPYNIPANSLIIDDVGNSVNPVRCAGRNWVNQGSLTWNFAADHEGNYRSKIDFHQIGGGLGGHFWFGHSYTAPSPMQITGTWTLNQALTGWARVLVHIPDHGAHTQQARYVVDKGSGYPAAQRHTDRYVNQRTEEHRWVSIGAFRFNGVPSVSLSNVTRDGEGAEDVAWDAIAFQPLPGKPANLVVAIGDSYIGGEGISTDAGHHYYPETDSDGDGVKGDYVNHPYQYDWKYGNACHRAKSAWPRLATAADNTSEGMGSRHDRWDPNLDLQFHACSWSETENLLPSQSIAGERITNHWNQGAEGLYREVSQLDMGYLDSETTLVMLAIGGNDAGFGAVMEHCAVPAATDCQDLPLPGRTQPLRVTGPQDAAQLVIPSVETVIRAIRVRAPNARIVLMGYPRLLSHDAWCVNANVPFFDGQTWREVGLGMNAEEAAFLNGAVNDLDDRYRQLALDLSSQGIPVAFADPRPQFQARAVCGNPAQLHSVILFRTEGEAEQFRYFRNLRISQQSFHPNMLGAAPYADALNQVLHP